MKPLAVLAGAALLAPLAAHAEGCADSATTQAAMNQCAQQAYQAADHALNAAYREATARLGGATPTRQRLVKAQRAWVAFRDAECGFVGGSAGDGSAAPMVELGCLEQLTQKRVQDLRGYLDCPEGDLACPLPRSE